MIFSIKSETWKKLKFLLPCCEKKLYSHRRDHMFTMIKRCTDTAQHSDAMTQPFLATSFPTLNSVFMQMRKRLRKLNYAFLNLPVEKVEFEKSSSRINYEVDVNFLRVEKNVSP